MIIRPLPMTDVNIPVAIDGMMPIHRFLSDFGMFSSLRNMLSQNHARPLMKRIDFMQQVTLYLPEVAALIKESDFGILQQEMRAMKLATEQALLRFDFPAVRKHLMLIGNLFEHADSELREAIHVSYLEGLLLGATSPAHQEARRLLSQPMEDALKQSELRRGILQRARQSQSQIA